MIEEEPFVLSPGPTPSEREQTARVGRTSSFPSTFPLPAGSDLATAAGGGADLLNGGASAGRARSPIERIGQGGKMPIVRGTVAGAPATFVIDTGAFDSILAGWFVKQLGEGTSTQRPIHVLDVGDRKVEMDRWSPLPLSIDGWGPVGKLRPPTTTDDALPTPRAVGLAGLLSPQRLAGSAAVVVDLVAGELVKEDRAAAEQRALGMRTSFVATPCGGVYATTARLEGKYARLVVDTGAQLTDVTEASPAGQALVGRSEVAGDLYGVGGPVGTRLIRDAKIEVLGTEGADGTSNVGGRFPLVIVKGGHGGNRCHTDGVLGMDVLSHCVLAIDRAQMIVGCDAAITTLR